MFLAEPGSAPSIFAYVDGSGRPLWTLVFILLFEPLAYINLTTNGSLVFNCLHAFNGLSTLFTWPLPRPFPKSMESSGHSIEELPFCAMFGVLGLLGGFDPRHFSTHRTVCRHTVQPERCRDCFSSRTLLSPLSCNSTSPDTHGRGPHLRGRTRLIYM